MIKLQSAYVYVVSEDRTDTKSFFYNEDRQEWVTNYLEATLYEKLQDIPKFSVEVSIIKITTIFEDFTRFWKNDKKRKSSY